MSETYFFDTYAFFEIIEGNPNYEKYVDCKIITTVFNLAELNYNLKKQMTKEMADKYVQDYFAFAVPINLKDIENATDLKMKNKSLSIPDVIGYIVAKRHGVKFLTGDEEFKDFENVKFVKK